MNVLKARQDTATFSNNVIYLDHAAGSVPPTPVLESMKDYLRELATLGPVNPTLYEKAARMTNETKEKVAKLINAKGADEIALTKTGSEAIGQIVNGIRWKKRDEIITSTLEISSGYFPLLRLAERAGIRLRVLSIDKRGFVDVKRVKDAFSRKTRLTLLSHISNALGTIQSVREVGELSKETDALYVVNASQSIGQIEVDVKKLGCDLLVAPCRKWLRGPQGLGILYCRKDLVNSLEPSHIGWNTTTWVTRNRYRHVGTCERFEAGELNFTAVAGLNRAVEYLHDVGGIDSIRTRILELTRYLLGRMREHEELQLYGDLDVETRGGIVAFDKRDVAPKMLADKLASEGIVIEAGNFAAPRVLKTFNRDKWARVCVHYFNDNEDIDRFITGLERVK